jgi:hypothetical protein
MNQYDIGYMERTRLYYRALGYTVDYQWAHFKDVPFSKPAKPLNEARLAIVTTAMPAQPEHRSELQVEATPVAPVPETLYTEHLSWDKENTHTREVATFLPIEQIDRLVAEGMVGELAPRFYSVPTEYSKRFTTDLDAPRILSLCREDHADLALLVPL